MRTPSLALALLLSAPWCQSAEFTIPIIPDVAQFPYPRITASTTELSRLQLEVVRDSGRDTIDIDANWHVILTTPPREKKP